MRTPVRDVTHSESRSVFHVPTTPTGYNNAYEDFEVIVATKQFGVPLERLRERNGGDPVPPVLRQCVEFIERCGMEVEGVFRRAPNTNTMHQIKKKFDLGERGLCLTRITYPFRSSSSPHSQKYPTHVHNSYLTVIGVHEIHDPITVRQLFCW